MKPCLYCIIDSVNYRFLQTPPESLKTNKAETTKYHAGAEGTGLYCMLFANIFRQVNCYVGTLIFRCCKPDIAFVGAGYE